MISLIYDACYDDYVTSYYPNYLIYPYRHTVYKKYMKDIKFDYWEYILKIYNHYNNYKPKCKYYIITYYILKYMKIKLKVYNFG